MTPATLIETGQNALAAVDARGGPPPHLRGRFLWAREVMQQATRGDGTLGAVWFVPLLKLAVGVLVGTAAAVGVTTLVKEGPRVGRSIGESFGRAADRGLNIALVGLSVLIGLQILGQFQAQRRRRAPAYDYDDE